MPAGLSFGPLAFELDGEFWSPLLEPFRSECVDPFHVTTVAGHEHEGAPAAAISTIDTDEVRLVGPAFEMQVHTAERSASLRLSSRSPQLGLLSGLSALLVWRATRAGLAVIHAGAVVTRNGVVALLAAPGGGKSTAARAAGDRAFSYNGLLVQPADGTCWPLPFTGGDDPALRSVTPGVLTAAVCLEKSRRFSVERIDGADATNALVRRLVCLRGDPSSVDVVTRVLPFAARLRGLRVRLPRGFDMVPSIDSMNGEGRVAE